MLRKSLAVLSVFMSLTVSGQDTTLTLPESQVIGIRTERREPTNIVRIVPDSIAPFVRRENDPFFMLERTVPGVYAQSDNGQSNGYSYLRMRGLDQTRINFNLNGIPLNEMEDQGIYFSNMPGFYNYLGEISVQKGVGTSKYGNSSIAGSVNMETRDPKNKCFEFNSFLGGNMKNHLSNVFYSSGIVKGVSVQAGATYGFNQGFKEHSSNTGGSVFYSVSSFRKNNSFRIYGFSGMSQNQLAFYGVDMETIEKNYRSNLNSITDRDTFKQNFTCLNWINTKNTNTKLNTSAYLNTVDGTYNTGGILFGVTSYQMGVMTNMVIDRNKNHMNLGFNTNIYSRNHFGSDSSGFFTDQNGAPAASLSGYTNTGYKKDATLYLKGIDQNEKFNAFYDLQVRSVWMTLPNFNRNWTFFNPKFGLKRIGNKNDLYINFGMTKREPTRTDIIQNMTQYRGLYGVNTDNTVNVISDSFRLNPEKLLNVETGSTFRTTGLEISTNGYFMNILNEYVSTGNMDFHSGLMEKKPMASTLRIGLDFNTKVRISDRFQMFWNMNCQHNRIDQTNHKIPFTPTYTSSFGTTYRIKSFWIGLTSMSVSSMYIDLKNTQKSMPYNVINGFAQYKYDRFLFSLKADNLFNNKYYIPAMMIGTVPTYYVGQLYNWSLNLNYKI